MPIVKSELKIFPYDPRWPLAFEAEAVRLRKALGPLALRIEHNGSTSIPGLAAKPIVDIQISVALLQRGRTADFSLSGLSSRTWRIGS